MSVCIRFESARPVTGLLPRVTCAVAFAMLLLPPGCKKQPPARNHASTASGDKCERALARIDRISAERSLPRLPKKGDEQELELCRHGRYAQYDPVLRCALDSPTDAVAAKCIDDFLNAVLKHPGKEKHGGRGVNPLLNGGTGDN